MECYNHDPMAHVIPDRILEEIRSRTSIVDVVSSRITLKRAGTVFKACCPFHKEKTPSFSVNPARESFKCFGCGEHGDVFSFLMKHDGMTFTDAVKMLGDRCGVEVEFNEDGGNAAVAKRMLALHTEIAEFYRRCLLQMKSAGVARDYLKSRALPDAIVENFKIGYAPEVPGLLENFASKNKYTIDEMVQAGFGTPLDRPRAGQNLHDRFRGRLMFPICDTQGRVIAFSGRVLDPAKSPAKYVNSPETEIFKKSRVLYALDKAQRSIVSAPHREAIICEGQIDVIRCHACGFDRAVASQGTAFTEEHAKLLKRYADSAIMVFDQDSAGQKAAVRTGAILLAAGIPVRVARLDAGDDPDSFLRKHPPEVFQKVLDDAIGLMPFHVQYLRAQESDPESEGAVGRIAAGVLQTVAVCLNEVHKARMLQEVAALLKIPESALESEMAGVEEVLRRQAETQERRQIVRAETRSTHPSLRGNSTSRSSDPVPFDEPMTYMDPEEHFPDVGVVGSGATRTGSQAKLPDKIDVSICELLVHNFYDNPEVTKFLVDRLPSWLLTDGLCRRIVEAYYSDFETGAETVLEMQNADKSLGEFLGAIAVLPNRAGNHESFSALDIAHDLVLAVWKRWCASRRAELTPASGADDSPDHARRRADLAIAVKKLNRWETGESVIRTLLGDSEPWVSIDIPQATPLGEQTGTATEGMKKTAVVAEVAELTGGDDSDLPPLEDLVPEFDEEPGLD